MKYLIISDSHHRNDVLKFLINEYKGYDIIHLGDRQMDVKGINIRGNCDETGDDEIVTVINEQKTLLTHGNYYQVKYTYEYLFNRAKELKCSLVLFGHTHKRVDISKDGIRLVNPGALQDGYYLLLNNSEFIFKKLGE